MVLWDLATIDAHAALYDPAKDANGQPSPPVGGMLAQADAAMLVPVSPPTGKMAIPISGDKHDLLNLSGHWFPGPGPGGLPWVANDAEINTEAAAAAPDAAHLAAMADAVCWLATASRVTGKAVYAARAMEHVHAWFLDPATYLSPNALYGDSIPGVFDEGSHGSMVFHPLVPMLEAVDLLWFVGQFSVHDLAGWMRWTDAFLWWLITNPVATSVLLEGNNQVFYYVRLVAALQLHVGRPWEARDTLERVPAMIDRQVMADGSLPAELARANSLSYSRFTAQALVDLDVMGRSVGLDLAGHVTPSGGSIPKVLDFLSPYLIGDAVWPYPQIGPDSPEFAFDLYYRTQAPLATIHEQDTRWYRSRLYIPEVL